MGDDESASSLILRLSSLGFDAIYARRGSRAFAKVLEAADLILCASPHEVADTVKATGRPPAPVVLVNAGLPDATVMLTAMRHGVIDVVTTPIGDGEFGERIETDLARARPTDLRIVGPVGQLGAGSTGGAVHSVAHAPAIADGHRSLPTCASGTAVDDSLGGLSSTTSVSRTATSCSISPTCRGMAPPARSSR